MPSSASCTTASGALISFFIGTASREECLERQCSQCAARQRSDHRYPRVTPIRRTLAGNREQRMDDARPEVARRIDRVAGRPAQGETYREHEETNDERRERVPGRRLVGEDR